VKVVLSIHSQWIDGADATNSSWRHGHSEHEAGKKPAVYKGEHFCRAPSQLRIFQTNPTPGQRWNAFVLKRCDCWDGWAAATEKVLLNQGKCILCLMLCKGKSVEDVRLTRSETH